MMPDHDGWTYNPALDKARLNAQQVRVLSAVSSGGWLTLREISQLTGDPEASVSARLRDLRKLKFGGHTVERRRKEGSPGTHEYHLLLGDE